MYFGPLANFLNLYMLSCCKYDLQTAVVTSLKASPTSFAFSENTVFKPQRCCIQVKNINLDDVSVEGPGIARVFPKISNLFWIQEPNLMASDVVVKFADGDADTVFLKDVACGTVEVRYTTLRPDKVHISVLIADVLHSTHSPIQCLSRKAAILYFQRSTNLSKSYCRHLMDHWHDAHVVEEALNCLTVFRWTGDNYTDLASTVVGAASLHLTNANVQLYGVHVAFLLACYGSVSNYSILLPYVYAAMEAHTRVECLQAFGCWMFRKMIDRDPTQKSILLQGQAVELCERAALISSYDAVTTLQRLL